MVLWSSSDLWRQYCSSNDFLFNFCVGLAFYHHYCWRSIAKIDHFQYWCQKLTPTKSWWIEGELLWHYMDIFEHQRVRTASIRGKCHMNKYQRNLKYILGLWRNSTKSTDFRFLPSSCGVFLADDNSQTIQIMISFFIAIATFTYLSVICECGERVTVAFVRFEDELNQCDWHLLPIRLHKLYVTFLMDAQRSINFQCYGGILCTRKTCKKVILFKIKTKIKRATELSCWLKCILFNLQTFIFILVSDN